MQKRLPSRVPTNVAGVSSSCQWMTQTVSPCSTKSGFAPRGTQPRRNASPPQRVKNAVSCTENIFASRLPRRVAYHEYDLGMLKPSGPTWPLYSTCGGSWVRQTSSSGWRRWDMGRVSGKSKSGTIKVSGREIKVACRPLKSMSLFPPPVSLSPSLLLSPNNTLRCLPRRGAPFSTLYAAE